MAKHRGEILKKAIDDSGKTITEIAKAYGNNRRNFYHMFQNRDLPLDTFIEIGKIINHDFSVEIPEIKKYVAPTYTQTASEPIEDYSKFNDQDWKDRYIKLLEQNNRILNNELANVAAIVTELRAINDTFQSFAKTGS